MLPISFAWERTGTFAAACVRLTQRTNISWDKNSQPALFQLVDWVLVCLPNEEHERQWELCQPQHGIYRIITKNDPDVVIVTNSSAPAAKAMYAVFYCHICSPASVKLTWTCPKKVIYLGVFNEVFFWYIIVIVTKSVKFSLHLAQRVHHYHYNINIWFKANGFQ